MPSLTPPPSQLALLYQVKIYNITYRDPSLRLAASTLKNGVFYTAQVRAWAESYNSSWSDWSPSVRWQNREYSVSALGSRRRVARGLGVVCFSAGGAALARGVVC